MVGITEETTNSFGGRVIDTTSPQYVRMALLSKGIVVPNKIADEFKRRIKEPLRTRAGAAGGLELILEDNSWVNVPTKEHFAKYSPYSLDYCNDGFVVKEAEEIVQNISFPKRPEYYDKKTSDGIPMSKIGIMLGDRLAFSITNACVFWGTEDGCQYCSIGLNRDSDLSLKKVEHITETAIEAISEGVANHIAINAGGLSGEDRGAKVYAKYARAITKKNDIPIAAQLLPPKKLEFVDLLKESGYTEATYDMEVYDWDINKRVSPGKGKIGRETYFNTLRRAVDVFGEGNVTSNLIVGLESPESTALGAEALAQIGVIPKLIIFRPLVGTKLEYMNPPSVEHMIKTYDLAIEGVKKYGGSLGPTCPRCNINRLNIVGSIYK